MIFYIRHLKSKVGSERRISLSQVVMNEIECVSVSGPFVSRATKCFLFVVIGLWIELCLINLEDTTVCVLLRI